MTHKERFYATIERKDVDRPASWLGIPTPEATKNLIEYFQVKNLYEITQIIEDDLYPVELPYHSPTSDAIYMAFDFTQPDQTHPCLAGEKQEDSIVPLGYPKRHFLWYN